MGPMFRRGSLRAFRQKEIYRSFSVQSAPDAYSHSFCASRTIAGELQRLLQFISECQTLFPLLLAPIPRPVGGAKSYLTSDASEISSTIAQTNTTPTPAPTFSDFTRLPPELRATIWKLALPDARLVPIQYQKATSTYTSRIRAPALLHACREPRAQARKTLLLDYEDELCRDDNYELDEDRHLLCGNGLHDMLWEQGCVCNILDRHEDREEVLVGDFDVKYLDIVE
ncbi:uncharacterized protein PAC_07735 [Phialocephala subalpina]|uniref:2EXR domain-containing protein n=1 Tax=Phialocephala subalpina TaxID=576137 RepID=A0A1L7WYK9_9HELO|nr:uncharacterized protein PAC_07735 [Phialocephala subalpina]